MLQPGGIACLAFLALFIVPVAATTSNFLKCLDEFKELNVTVGGTDYDGTPVANPLDAVGLTYTACVQYCSPKREPFDWTRFSQQFSAWLIPWLALISQLPFGAKSRLDNLISVVLTVGSPTLAAYSLALTAVNTRWANSRFSDIKYPNRRSAVKALIYLQQVPLRLTTRDGLLASLIVLPENDDWWECLVDRLEHTHTWTIAAAASMAWVIIAFILATIDSLTNVESLHSSGKAIGSLWLWLIPVVVGWLWIPFSSYEKLRTAIDRANDLAILAASDGPLKPDIGVEDSPSIDGSRKYHPQSRAYDLSRIQAFRMSDKREVLDGDVARTSPMFNYARTWEWWCIVEMVAQAFEHADRNAESHTPVDLGRGWVQPKDRRTAIHRDNRTGTIEQVQAYCGFTAQGKEGPERPLPSGAWERIFVASVFALGLQWGTTGSGIVIAVFTPTTGLGCRSSSYILYGTISTIIWFTLVFSSYLAHRAKAWRRYSYRRSGFDSVTVTRGLATFLRRLSILAASCNSIWIIIVCIFEFSNVYSTCYCNSSVLGRGVQHAYNLIITTGHDYGHTRAAWAGGFLFAGGCAALYLLFLSLMVELQHRADYR